MQKIVLGAALVVLVGTISAVGYWAIRPEAAVTQACSGLRSVDSFDIELTYTLDETALGVRETVIFMELEGDLSRSVYRQYLDGVESPLVNGEIIDYANMQWYSRLGDDPWNTGILNKDSAFPRSRDSICPDLTDASVTLIGNDTVNGQTVRKYSYATESLFDWYVWVDANGWLIQVESTHLPVSGALAQSGQSGDRFDPGFDAVATVSGRGEANSISIPQVGQ